MKYFSKGGRILASAIGVSASVAVGGFSLEKYKKYSTVEHISPLSGAKSSFPQFFQLKAEAANVEENYPKPGVIFVLGGPGSGKGTQCARISEKYGYVHLSAGDLLRAEKSSPGSKFGDLIQEHLKNGTLVPTSITCSLLERAMHDSDTNNFLIDGFPRGEENLSVWNDEMGGKVDLQCVLFFNCSQEVSMQRCLARGAAGSGRADDNEESLKKRFKTYEETTMPVIQQFDKLGLVRKIDASRSPDDIFADVQIVMNDFM